MPQTINGIVEHVVYQNSQTGYAVIELGCLDEYVTVVGPLAGITQGEEITATGDYVNHPSFGVQFKAVQCEYRLPDTSVAILKYLSSGVLPGIGPVIARRIVDEFGTDTFNIIEQNPKALAGVQGLNYTKAQKIQAEFRRIFGIREAIQYLGSMGVSASLAIEAYRHFGEVCVQVISENPYLLCGYPVFVPFEQIDRAAQTMEIDKESSHRVSAGVLYVLRHNLNNGHTCLPKNKMLPACVNFLDVEQHRIELALDELVRHGEIIICQYNDVEYAFLPEYYKAELYTAMYLKGLMRFPPPQDIDAQKVMQRLQITSGIEYAPLQKKAICTAITNNALVLTGGPGTGKTTTVNAILTLLEQSAERVALAAPTGRAAKRLSQLTGRQAKTIHRLLEVDYMSKSDTIRFVHNEQNKLKCDVVIIDEMSMVDALLFESLLAALKPNCRLIMVGDFDQLPSVGAGNVLKGIIDSGIVPVICLKEIFRQAAKSTIVTNAHRIVEGEMPVKGTKNDDCFFIETPKHNAQRLIVDLVANRLPESYGYAPINDIQVLCPTKIGEVGTIQLNAVLQAKLNPPHKLKPQFELMGQIYRKGDKVMQIKNNYDILYSRDDGEEGAGAFNGDIGIIENVDAKGMTLKIRFDDRVYSYATEYVRQLELAYAVTIHKSQGCEFNAVVLPICEVPEKLRYRNLLYTGVTRAKDLLVLAGQSNLLAAMVKNDKRTLRYSCLTNFILDVNIM